MANRRKISYLWNFFSVIDETMAKCNMCAAKLSYKTSTTNLKRHIQAKHSTVSLEPQKSYCDKLVSFKR